MAVCNGFLPFRWSFVEVSGRGMLLEHEHPSSCPRVPDVVCDKRSAANVETELATRDGHELGSCWFVMVSHGSWFLSAGQRVDVQRQRAQLLEGRLAHCLWQWQWWQQDQVGRKWNSGDEAGGRHFDKVRQSAGRGGGTQRFVLLQQNMIPELDCKLNYEPARLVAFFLFVARIVPISNCWQSFGVNRNGL